MKSILCAFVLTLLLSSCASFSNRMVNKNKSSLSENDLVKLEGTYVLFPDTKYDKKGNLQTIDSEKPETIHSLNYFVKSERLRYEYSDSYRVEVKLLGKNRLQFVTKKKDSIVENVELGGKLKNGFFYLDNKYLKRHGVPYLAGGYDNHKTRIGLSKDNGLLVNYAYDNSGALIFMFWAGSTYNLAYHFKRIEK